jgi:ABC-type bacteriocin/lantibiotic exporter with double-glycine peptidase domain
MLELIHQIEKKVNSIVFALIGDGIMLVALGILIVWTDFALRLTVGIFVLVVAYLFFYGAYKMWAIKNDIKKHFKI